MKELFKNLFKAKDLQVRVKKVHPKAVIPCYAKDGDAGMDLTAVSRSIDADGNAVYGTGLAFEIPEGYVGLIYPLEKTSKQNIILTNCIGMIHPKNSKEVILRYKPLLGEFDKYGPITRYAKYANDTNLFRIGEKVAKLVIIPYCKACIIEETK